MSGNGYMFCFVATVRTGLPSTQTMDPGILRTFRDRTPPPVLEDCKDLRMLKIYVMDRPVVCDCIYERKVRDGSHP